MFFFLFIRKSFHSEQIDHQIVMSMQAASTSSHKEAEFEKPSQETTKKSKNGRVQPQKGNTKDRDTSAIQTATRDH
jgi:hypothetical protein